MIKVWNSNHTIGRLIVCRNFEELIMKVKTKFDIHLGEVKLMLSDGCQIDEEGFTLLQTVTDTIYVIKEGEQLSTTAGQSSRLASTGSSDTSENLMSLVKRIRGKQTSLNRRNEIASKRRRSMIKLNYGWMCYSENCKKYIQIRTPRGGGTRVLEFNADDDYMVVLNKGKELFFPNGISNEGKLEEYSHCLGDFKANILNQSGFTVRNYADQHCLTTRPRIYLLSKKVLQVDQDDVDDDWDLPSLDGLLSNPEPIVISQDNNQLMNDPEPIIISQDNNQLMNDLEPIIISQDNNQLMNDPEPIIISQDNNHQMGTNTNFQLEPHNNVLPSGSTNQSNLQSQSNINDILSETTGSSNTTQTLPEPTMINQESPEMIFNNLQQEQTTPPTNALQLSTENTMPEYSSPVTIRLPPIPTCVICKDRYSDSFLTPCGHILCAVCAAEMEERNHRCHICRNEFQETKPLFY